MKRLEEMTDMELWRLFPIALTPSDENWKEYYRHEAELITDCLGKDFIERISHIGSTAIPNLIAKPTIDILLEIAEDSDLCKLKNTLKKNGYIFTKQPRNPAPHMMFMKGYTPNGFAEKVYHVHVRYFGDWDEFYFRDYLTLYPEEAAQYGELKTHLRTKFQHDRDGYTEAKTEFIRNIMGKARKELQNSYKIGSE